MYAYECDQLRKRRTKDRRGSLSLSLRGRSAIACSKCPQYGVGARGPRGLAGGPWGTGKMHLHIRVDVVRLYRYEAAAAKVVCGDAID